MDKKDYDISNLAISEADTIKEKSPWKTIVIYIILGFLWILFSDRFVDLFADSHETYKLMQSYKGVFYVVVTAVILFYLIKYDYSKIMKLTNDISEKNEELVSFSEELIAMDEDLQQKIESLNIAMKSINEQKQFIDDIFQNSNTSIITWGLDGEVLEINNHFTELLGYDRQDIIGKKWYEVLLPKEEKYKYYELTSKLESDRKAQNYENKLLAKDGRLLDMLWNNALIYNPQNDLTVVVSFGINLTMQKQNDRRIYELAYNDKLTGFKNLIAFENDINSKINKKTSFTLYYLDMDNFKHLNEIHGHKCGDMFLKDYSSRLLTIFDRTNVYRWCGDEFVVIEEDTNDINITKRIDEIALLTKDKWRYENVEYYPSASIGITKFPDDAENLEGLKKNMDMALYKAKSSGKSLAVAYHSDFQKDIEKMLGLENTITEALINESFRLVFQPIYSIKTGKIILVEALIRCKSVNINIGELINTAEESGQILQIDRWVIKKAFEIMNQDLDKFNIKLAINLSAKSIANPDLIDFLSIITKEYNINPNQIEFELTEHSLIFDIDRSKEVIGKLKHLGFGIALDDFGTRYSSLNYLSSIPFDSLKIDKSYIDKIVATDKSRVIVEQIIKLSHNLGLTTVAEGIEENEQLDILIKLDCDYGQGYLLDKPLELEDLIYKLDSLNFDQLKIISKD